VSRTSVRTSRTATRGRVQPDPPPLAARRRTLSSVLAALVTATLAACSSSGGSSATPTPTALRIPSPYEVGQQIGLGNVTLAVPTFTRDGEQVTVAVTASNAADHPITIDPQHDFTIFYGTDRHPEESADGSAVPLAPGAQAAYTLHFRVPARYPYPLLWFDGTVAGASSPSTTVVLREKGA